MFYPPTTPEVTRWCALVLAIVTSIQVVFSAISLIDAERTGVIFYSPDPRIQSAGPVSRKDSPAGFSEAMSITAFHATLPAALMCVSIWFYRRLGE